MDEQPPPPGAVVPPPSDIIKGEQVLAPMVALVETDPRDKASRDKLLYEHCVSCRKNWGRPEVERAAGCFELRCGLCDPDRLAEERRILMVLTALLEDPNNADDETVEALNSHIAHAGCATIGLGNRRDGFRRLAFAGGNLRACLHRSVILYLSWRAGDRIHMNVNAMTTEGMQEVVQVVRADAREEGALRDHLRVCALFQQGISVRKIAKEMGWGDDRQRVNEHLYDAGLKQRPSSARGV